MVRCRKFEDWKISDSPLENPDCDGPENLYCISMDVGKKEDRDEIVKRNLLFGAVTYAEGKIGDGPVRSQGHIHAVSPSCGSSTPEVYEIWEGEAVIYMQESAKDDAGNLLCGSRKGRRSCHCSALLGTCNDQCRS